MATDETTRDYRLTGPENARAVANGLVRAERYKSPVPRRRLIELSRRTNGPAVRDTLIGFALLIGAGIVACRAWGTWWAVPAFAVYGTLYASTGDSRWHECLHGTAFKTPRLNTVVHHIGAFMILRQATPWRWSHLRHHRETMIVGRDPEIPLRPGAVRRSTLTEILHLYGSAKELKELALHCLGRLDEEEKAYIPESQVRQVIWEARAYAFIFLLVAAACVYMRSLLPAMLVGLPSFYGITLVLMTGAMQHVGLPEDTLDFRLNSRTVRMNPVIRFLYLNMNYHLDHHMYPGVPYHALPALHEEIKGDCPTANPGLLSGFKEIIETMKRTRQDPSYVLIRPLPDTARPYQLGQTPASPSLDHLPPM